MFCTNPECADFLATGALVILLPSEPAEEARAAGRDRARRLSPKAAPLPGPLLGLDARADGSR